MNMRQLGILNAFVVDNHLRESISLLTWQTDMTSQVMADRRLGHALKVLAFHMIEKVVHPHTGTPLVLLELAALMSCTITTIERNILVLVRTGWVRKSGDRGFRGDTYWLQTPDRVAILKRRKRLVGGVD